MLIDTHCHLNFKVFADNVLEVINAAKAAGVEKIIVPGTNLETSRSAVELATQYPQVYASIGIHPHHAGIMNDELRIMNELKQLATHKKVVAIGECGLDYYVYQKTKYPNYQIDEQFKQKQKKIFLLQIELAIELNLPLIIHNRDADSDLLALLKSLKGSKYKSLKGVFHCMQGNEELLNWGLEHNYYFGITGLVTYNHRMQAMVKKTTITKLLSETDAPFLIPEPLKSRHIFPNSPQNVKIIVERIASLKGDSFLTASKQLSDNAVQLFKVIK